MNAITITPIKDSEQKTIAYIVPADKYDDFMELEALEDEYLAEKAKEAIAGGWVSPERQKYLNKELDKIGK